MSEKPLLYAALKPQEQRIVDHWITVMRGPIDTLSPMVVQNLRESHARGLKEDPEIAKTLTDAYTRAHPPREGGPSIH